MTACHLVTDSDLTLLGNIHLCDLHYAVGEFVTNLDLVYLSLGTGFHLLVGDAVAADEFTHHSGSLGVVAPLCGGDVLVVNLAESLEGELLALGEDLNAVKVRDTGALLAVYKAPESLDEAGAEFLRCLLELLSLDFHAGLLVTLGTPLAGFLGNLCIEGGLDDGTAQGRIGLQGSVLDVTGFVAEDGLEEFLFR